MIKFPELFIFILIIASIGGIAVGAISLLIILIRDIKSKKLW